MRGTLHGRLGGPAVGAIGVWDPFLPAHQHLCAALVANARATGRAALAILLDPDPRWLLYGPARWPVYDEAATRRRLIRATGVDAVLHLAVRPVDVHSGAAEVFALVARRVKLAELWLGTRQRLGSGELGSAATVQRPAQDFGIAITRLPEGSLLPLADEVRGLLARGRLGAAARLVGRPPVRRRPATGELRLAWSPGAYRVVGGRHPAGERAGFTVTLQPRDDGPPALVWPDAGIPHLTFAAGPGDAAPATLEEVAMAG